MTPVSLLRPLAVVLTSSLFVANVPLVSAATTVPCNCEFSGDNDTEGCVVYGQLGDGELIPWNVAPQACLDYYSIKDEAIDPNSLTDMFPNPDGTGGNPGFFVNYLRFDDGSIASGFKASFPQFFIESTTQPGKMVLQEEIKVGSLTYVCSPDKGGNEGSCWTAIRTYFSREPGDAEMAAIGKSLYGQQAVSREKEQVLVRIRICSDGPPDGGECGALAEQVQKVKENNPDKFCSAFGLGPKAGNTYPKCGEENINSDDSSGAAVSSFSVGFYAAAAAATFHGMVF